ncbi:hypothetical protein C4K39_3060 [Pseudomonas sessilinigenes]|nr:hypothetical protein C4K39_3060 [Pseudomonas sessilinigenes]
MRKVMLSLLFIMVCSGGLYSLAPKTPGHTNDAQLDRTSHLHSPVAGISEVIKHF